MADGRGGKREGSGRKRNDPPTNRCCVYISDQHAALLRKWGRGNLSDGLRWLIDAAELFVMKPDAEGK